MPSMSRTRTVPLLLVLASSTIAVAAPEVLHQQSSAFGQVIVSEHDGLRILQFEPGGVRQSVVRPGHPEHLALPYMAPSMAGLALVDPPQRVLVIGMGGGSMPMFIRHFYPDAQIDAVDIDPVVVEVAAKYFGFREDERMHAHAGDGRAFVERVNEPYDLIFLDAYGADSAPPALTTLEFLTAVRRALTPDGVVVGNLWSSDRPRYASMVRTYLEAFEDLFVLRVAHASNRIVLALPRRSGLGIKALATRATAVSTTRGFPFDLGELVRFEASRGVADAAAGRVLRDAELLRKP